MSDVIVYFPEIKIGPPTHKGRIIPSKAEHLARVTPFVKGNQLAKAENLTEDANRRRFLGLRKTWKKISLSKGRRGKGLSREQKKFRSPRIRLRLTVEKEAREIQAFARKNAQAALERLATIVNDPHSLDNVAVAASVVLLERAYGKPNQTNTNVNIDANGKPTEVSTSEIDQRIAATLKRVEAITGRTVEAPKSKEQPADLRKRDRDPDGTNKQLH